MTKFVIFTSCIVTLSLSYTSYNLLQKINKFEGNNLVCTIEQNNELHIFKCTKSGNLVTIKLN